MDENLTPGPPTGHAVDLDPARRPGVPQERTPQPWPNTRFPPSRQQGAPSAPRHGRPGKRMPPVWGTAVPLHGVSGTLRKAAYAYPDHYLRHWLMLLFADRVDAWGTRAARTLTFVAPAAALGYFGGRSLAGRR